ncbi:MAG: hypothetical protein NTY15_10115 [Planctomycetota bacterium]|nr:hypothetical protein [Planctomycetota bacterium]
MEYHSLIDPNPYAAPTTSVERTLDIVEQAKLRLARPATALVVMASIQSVFPAILLVSGTFDFFSGQLSGTKSIPLFIAAAQFTALLLIAIGAAKMGFLESSSMGRMAAILSCIPFVTPFVFIGIPFGIWSLRLLSDPEINRAFQTTAERRKSA